MATVGVSKQAAMPALAGVVEKLDKSPHVRRNSDHNPLFPKVDGVSRQSGYYSELSSGP